jgi:hypothetical protein
MSIFIDVFQDPICFSSSVRPPDPAELPKFAFHQKHPRSVTPEVESTTCPKSHDLLYIGADPAARPGKHRRSATPETEPTIKHPKLQDTCISPRIHVEKRPSSPDEYHLDWPELTEEDFDLLDKAEQEFDLAKPSGIERFGSVVRS